MKLYYSKGACSLAIRILLHEIGVTCEYEAVNLKTKQTETGKDYLKISEKGAVPVLEIDDQTVLTENVVIQQYLAETYHATRLLPAIGDFKRYRVLEWLVFITTDLHKNFSPLFNQDVPQEVKDRVFLPVIRKKLTYVEAKMSDEGYLMGDFTLADCYLFVMLLWLPNFKEKLSAWPKLERYFERMKKRASVVEALREESLGI